MTYQEKKFRDKRATENQKGSKEDPDKFNQQAGSRVSEAEESKTSVTSREDDIDTLDDEDEDNLY